jgi:hypothetical protein
MSPPCHNQTDHLDDDHAHGQVEGQSPEAQDGEGEVEDDHKVGSGIAGWPISLAIHGLLALIFCYIVFAAHKDEEELAPMRVTTMDAASALKSTIATRWSASHDAAPDPAKK